MVAVPAVVIDGYEFLACERCGNAAHLLTQVCGPCGETLCPACYGTWTALACNQCRRHHPYLGPVG